MHPGGGEAVEEGWRGADSDRVDVARGGVPAGVRGLHGVEGGGGGDDEDSGERVKGDGDYGELRGSGPDCDGDVLRREDAGEHGGGDRGVPPWEAWQGRGCGACVWVLG